MSSFLTWDDLLVYFTSSGVSIGQLQGKVILPYLKQTIFCTQLIDDSDVLLLLRYKLSDDGSK